MFVVFFYISNCINWTNFVEFKFNWHLFKKYRQSWFVFAVLYVFQFTDSCEVLRHEHIKLSKIERSLELNVYTCIYVCLTARDVFKLYHSKYKKSDLTVHSSFFEIYSGKVSQ